MKAFTSGRAMALGAANEEIYGQLLKLSQDEMAALRAAGII